MVGGSWDRGFIGAVTVTNKSGPARTWTVKITYPASARVRVGNVWNASVDRQGDTFVFTGGPLAPGATATFGFEASKQVRDRIQPAGCTVDGASCRLS
jgi:cellulase/cellobiase CelA1